jgi:3-phosphoshikimate 1-carboxyvinyltransferase
MTATILPGPCSELMATVQVPASKSLTNRALLAAAVAGGGRVVDPLDCEDTRLLARALAEAGWPVRWGERTIEVGPRRPETTGLRRLWLGNSGTGARLLLGLLSATPGRFLVDGGDRLRVRPMGPLLGALRRLGATLDDRDGFLPVTVEGRRLAGGHLTIRPEVSSQFVSSLLLAAPLMADGLELEVEGDLPSAPYVALTEEVLAAYGVRVEHAPTSRRWRIPPGGVRSASFRVEGDWSAAAFFAAAAAVGGGQVAIEGVTTSSRQGDRALCGMLSAAGVRVEEGTEGVIVLGPAQDPFAADVRQTPDLFPALVTVAAVVGAGCELRGVEHLRHKESDRVAVMVDNLTRLGAELEVGNGTVTVRRPLPRRASAPVRVTAASDHRVAMAMAVAALARGAVELDEPECVGKSFPTFWEVWGDMLREPG